MTDIPPRNMSSSQTVPSSHTGDGHARALRDAAAGPLARQFPVRWLEEHAVLPMSLADSVVHVAAGAEVPHHVVDAIGRTLGATAQTVHYPAAEIRAALVASTRENNATKPAATFEQTFLKTLQGDTTESLDDLRAQASREPVIQVVNALLSEAVRSGASDIHFESTADGLRVRMRRDGVLHDVQQLGSAFHAGVLSRLKVVASLDIAERRLPQDGRARVRIDDRDIDIRVASLPALHGESLVLRLLDSGSATARSMADLGIPAAVRDAWTRLVARNSGLLLVTGPTGSGKTTTLYAALAARSTAGVKVVTVEDPVEYRLDGVVQLPVNAKAGFGFANALRAILRHDPDVIFVGELRDTETAELAVQAALTGHLVLSTLHTTDAIGALARLTEMRVPPYLLAATLQGVLAQRLVRVTCESCGTWRALTTEEHALVQRDQARHASTDAMRDAMHDSSATAGDATIIRVRVGSGCDACAHTGYRGRAAITELLVFDDTMRAAFVDGASTDALRTLSRAQGTRSLIHDGWRAVVAGLTTIDEVTRVVSDDSERR